MATSSNDTPSPSTADAQEEAEAPPPGWGTDDQISFSKETGKYLQTNDDGSEMEYNSKLKAWMPVVYDDELAAQQSAYSVAGVDETAPIERPKKRKKKQTDYTGDNNEKRAKQGNDEEKPRRERHSTSVYVSNLPFDISAADVQEYFAKCGVIAEDASGSKRVKLYYDEDGKFKGDALVTYFKPESVPLALQLLDETELTRANGRPSPLIRVQVAEFKNEEAGEEHKEPKETKKRSAEEVRRLQRRRQKLESKLADWDDNDYPQHTSARWGKVVILRYMFTLKELEEDPVALIELKQDVREECEKLGEVTNVVLFDGEEDGIMSVRFADEQAAIECVKACPPQNAMNGRYFSGRQIEAEIYDGKVRYKKSKGSTVGDEAGDETTRLEKFGAWLEDGNEG